MSERPRVVILSAGGTAREAAHWLARDYRLVGFLDDVVKTEQVVGPLSAVEKFATNALVFSALGSYRSMAWRMSFLERLQAVQFVGMCASATVYPTAILDRTSVLFPGSVLSSEATMGKHSFLYHGVIVSHDSKVGDYSILANGAVISGGVMIGSNCYVGANATILEGRKVGNNSIIAAGAVVVSDVPPCSIYIGPGRIKPNGYLPVDAITTT